MKFKFLIAFSLIVGLVLPSFGFAQEGIPQMPQNMDEAKNFGMKILTSLPQAVKEVWQEQAWPIFLGTWYWFQGPWNNYVQPYIELGWKKFLDLLDKETPDLKEEFQKEKTEMQDDLWQRFKDLLR